MIKADFRAWTTTLMNLLPPALVVLVWSLSGISVWALYGAMLLVGGEVVLIRNVWRFQRAEGRRQAAVVPESGYHPLARIQPLPNAAALSVPSTITQQAGWLAYVLSLPVAWCGVVFSPLLVAPARVLHPTLSFIAISLLLAGAISIWYLLSPYQRIEIYAEGLTVKSAFRRQTIHWSEARLFAIDGVLSFTDPPTRYELSSARTIVRWERQTSPSPLVHLGQPFADYDRQIKALHAFIAAQTGLPLVDVRQPRVHAGAASQLPPESSRSVRLPSDGLPE